MKIDPTKINGNERIPTPPGVAMKLLEISQDPDAVLADLVKVISVDPAITAKIISFCNSPLIGRKCAATTLQAAVFALGKRLVTTLGLSFSLMDNKDNSNSGFDYDSFWSRSLALAISCKVVSKSVGGNPEENFLLGLLLNIGQIGIASTFGDQMLEMEEQENLLQHDLVCQFAKKHSLDPYQIGGGLLEKWSFPTEMSCFVKNFRSEAADCEKAKIIQAGEKYVTLLMDSDTNIFETRDELSQLIGSEVEQFQFDYESIANEYIEFASILDFDVDCVCAVEDLEHRAKELLLLSSLRMAGDIERISNENECLENDANFDSLTGLKNRRAYDTQVSPAIESSRERSQSFGLAVLDIDHFRDFNNTYGHHAGDAVLKAVGREITNAVRDTDEVFRFGGEEFVILLADCSHDQVSIVAERVRASIEKLQVQFEGQELKVTISSGAVWSKPDCKQPLTELFKLADQLLYEAKEQGRNQCVFKSEQRRGTTSVNVSS